MVFQPWRAGYFTEELLAISHGIVGTVLKHRALHAQYSSGFSKYRRDTACVLHLQYSSVLGHGIQL